MPPEEELPPFPGRSKQSKAPERPPPTLSLQQQAEATRVTIRRVRRAALEDEAPSSRRIPPSGQLVQHGGKRLTPLQQRVLGEAYGDRVRKREQPRQAARATAAPPRERRDHGRNERWEYQMLQALKTRSDSVTSEELADVLSQLEHPREQRTKGDAQRTTDDAHEVNTGASSKGGAELGEVENARIDRGVQEKVTPNIDQIQTKVTLHFSRKSPVSGVRAIRPSDEDGLAEVLEQFDKEDGEESHGDTDDLDYVDADTDDLEYVDDGSAREESASEVQSSHGYEDNSVSPEVEGDQGVTHAATDKQARPKSAVQATGFGMEEAAPVSGDFLEGFPIYLDSWSKFFEVFADFQERTFQMFSCRTSTSVDARNRAIACEQEKAKKAMSKRATKKGKKSSGRAVTGGTLLPASWDKYSRTYLCTHGMPYENKSSGRRGYSKVRSTGCSARVNVRVCARSGGNGFHLQVKASGIHNHRLTEHQWYDYAENRRITDPQLREEVAVMTKAGAKPRGILEYLRSKTGKRTALKDVHNMVQQQKRVYRAGKSDVERALAVLEEFVATAPGNTAEFLVDSDTNVVRVVTFQSARMKRLFTAFPEVVLVDSTHGTNANRYKLFSFAVHDVFGRGQYVQHALVQTEEKANLELAVDVFKRNNPEWANIRVVMTDKALHEKDVLHKGWPKARQLLCKWHVETWLKKQCSRLGGLGVPETKKLKVIMKGLVNSESQQEYDDFKDALLETLGNDKENHLYKSFMQHWDSTTDEWVMFERGGVPHLKNNTNNRLESKWGRLKEIIDGNFTIDELLSMLIMMQDYAEERYLAELHRVGRRQPRLNEDPELTGLAMQLSDYAFNMVAEQHKLAGGPNASYDLHVNGVKATLTNPATGKTHEVDALLSTCDCIFMQTCLLPCRHVMWVRSQSNYETVIPPLRTFSKRWIVQSPVNNIDDGEVSAGGLNRVNCPPIKALPPVDRDTKYSRCKQLTDRINDVASLQPSTTYRLAIKWLEGFHTALHTGKLEDFTGPEPTHGAPYPSSDFPSLSQISIGSSVTLSQLSFANAGDDNAPEAEEEVDMKPTQPTGGPEAVTTPTPLSTTSAPTSPKRQLGQIMPKSVLAESASGTVKDPIVFSSPPKRRGLSRRAEKKDESRKEMKEAKRIMTSIREGKKARAVKLSHMEILFGPYSASTTKPIVDRLDLPSVEVHGVLAVVRWNVGQPVPVVKAIPQLEIIRHSIRAIEETKNHSLLVRWDSYGYATYEQLKLMEAVVLARNNFALVQATVDWIDKVECPVESLVEPFKDTQNVAKADYKKAVEDLNLGRWYVGKHEQHGKEFLDFRENVWLHTGSIIGALFMLRETYQDVGVINPRFLDFATMEQRMRIARSYGAAEPGLKKILTVVNLGNHWGAMFVDVGGRRCYLFDPMHLESNLTELKKAARTVVEKMLDMTDQLQFEVVTGCKQQDSSSCGLWSLVVLELLLFGATPQNWDDYWSDSLYKVVDYLRLRYLHKVISLERYFEVGDEEMENEDEET